MTDPLGVVTFLLRDQKALEGFFSILEYYNREGKWPPLPVVADVLYTVTTNVWFRSGPVVTDATKIVVLPKDTKVKFLGKSTDGSFNNVELLADVDTAKKGQQGWVSASLSKPI